MRHLFLTITVLILTACGGSSGSLNYLTEDAVILAFGDSLTYGKGARAEESYPAVLESLINRNVIRSGISGELSAAGLQRLPSVLAEHNPDLVILIHGGNDMLRKKNLETAADNIRRMIQLCRENGADVIMMSVPKPTLILSPADFYEEVATELNVPIVIGEISSIMQYPDNKSDAAHPNAKGYRMMAESIKTLLEQHGAI